MRLSDWFRQTNFFTNIIPLVSLVFGSFVLLILLLSNFYGNQIDQLAAVVDTGKLESQKMRLNSEMMEAARKRYHLIAQLIDIDDPFAQDEINMRLQTEAGRFAGLRAQLLQLELNDQERLILEQQGKAVERILPAMRQIVELAMTEDPTADQQAKQILYDVVMPTQGRMIDLFSQLISLEQKNIELLAINSQLSVEQSQRRTHLLLMIAIGGIIMLSALVIFPITATHGIIGALSISAFPFTSGFVTKSLETQAAANEGMLLVWLLLLAASAGVFLHAGIKFPWFVFFQKDSGLRPPEAPANLRLAMWLFSFLCLAIGIYPQPLYAILPYPVDYQPYTVGHLVTQFQVLLFAGFAFFVMLKQMRRTLTISLDFDWFYRKFFREIGKEFTVRTSIARRIQEQRVVAGIGQVIDNLYRHHGPQGILARAWPTGSMVIWVAVMLGLSLALYYI